MTIKYLSMDNRIRLERRCKHNDQLTELILNPCRAPSAIINTTATIACATQLGPASFHQRSQQRSTQSLFSSEASSLINYAAAANSQQRLQPSRVSDGTPPLSIHQGPGIDLVAFNKRRFELGHNHQSLASREGELKQGELFESNLASLPGRLLTKLPDSVNRQMFESMATDTTLNIPSFFADSLRPQQIGGDISDDPDGASVERLTKSCLTVHASSARPEQLNVTFHLYTENNPQVPFIVKSNITRLELIKSSPFDPGKPIKWITHGFHTNVDKSGWMIEAKNKILAFEDANVFLTDWRRGASPAMAFYPKAAANAHVVAKMIVRILRRLRADIDFARVHLIGHSLGAHIMGFVGSAFTEEYLLQQQQLLMLRPAAESSETYWRKPAANADSQLIGRITACDPALPCFGPTSSAAQSPIVAAAPPQQPAETTGASLILFTSSDEGNDKFGSNDGRQQQQQAVLSVAVASVDQQGTQAREDRDSLGFDWTPSMWTHLRPDSAVVVEVMHSNPGVMGYAEPLGDYDFYPNGFERQPGCGVHQADGSFAATLNGKIALTAAAIRGKRQLMSTVVGSVLSRGQQQLTTLTQAPGERLRLSQTLGRFIKPIRDFFHGYTCSHHRAVEYMVESMYYEQIPQDRKLDRDFVCQMVGYRCSDYSSFKRGFCFQCFGQHDCRAFTMFGNSLPDSINTVQGDGNSAAAQSSISDSRSGRSLRAQGFAKFNLPNQTSSVSLNNANYNGDVKTSQQQPLNSIKGPRRTISNQGFFNASRQVVKRVLPTLNHYDQNYRRQKGNQYYFDTRHVKEFCLNHYHLFVKYRWFRVHDAVVIDGFTLSGTLANITQRTQVTFNRFTYQSYTMLLTERQFLGQIESLSVFGDRIKAALVEYIEVSYMSNLDPRIRALGSARLCRVQQSTETLSNTENFVDSTSSLWPNKPQQASSVALFVRCSGTMV